MIATGIPSGTWTRDRREYHRRYDKIWRGRFRQRVSNEPRDSSALYNRAIGLYQQGLRPPDIARELRIRIGIIYKWIHREYAPRSGFCGHTRLVNLEPTEDLGYLTGLVFGDGSISHSKKTRNREVRLSTTDPELLECFIDVVRKLGLNPHTWKRQREREKWGRFYRQTELCASADSKILYEFLGKYKLPDYRWQYPQECGTNGFAKGFLQGIFDAEGCVALGNRQAHKYFKLVSLCQKPLENIRQVKELLSGFGINCIAYERKKGGYDLSIGRWRDLKLFHRLIGFRLPRKQQKLEKMIAYYKKPAQLTLLCGLCGKEFKRYPSDMRRGGGKYCSLACRNAAYKRYPQFKQHLGLFEKGNIPWNQGRRLK